MKDTALLVLAVLCTFVMACSGGTPERNDGGGLDGSAPRDASASVNTADAGAIEAGIEDASMADGAADAAISTLPGPACADGGWCLVDVPDGAQYFWESVWAPAADEVWLGGQRMGAPGVVVLQWDGSAWVEHTLTAVHAENVTAIWGVAGHVWIGTHGFAYDTYDPIRDSVIDVFKAELNHWDGTQWELVALPFTRESHHSIEAIAGDEAGPRWIAAGELLALESGVWALESFSAERQLAQSLGLTESGGALVGTFNEIHLGEAGAWTVTTSAAEGWSSKSVTSLWTGVMGASWAAVTFPGVGSSCSAGLEWTGGAWATRTGCFANGRLEDLRSDGAGHLWAVNTLDGSLWAWDGAAWRVEIEPAGGALRALDGDASVGYWAAGVGVVYRRLPESR